jgi:hypothetical protein
MPRKSFHFPFWARVARFRQPWSRAWVSNLFTARYHNTYCWLFRGLHIERLQYVVFLTAPIIVKVYSIYIIYRCFQRPYNTTWRAAGWRPMDVVMSSPRWLRNRTTTPTNENSQLRFNLNNYFSGVSSDHSLTVEPSRIWYGESLELQGFARRLEVTSFLRGTFWYVFSCVPCSCGLISFSYSNFE